MKMKKLLIAFILFLLLLILIVQLPIIGKFIQGGEDPIKPNNYSTKTSDAKWQLIGKVQIENGRIMSINITSAK